MKLSSPRIMSPSNAKIWRSGHICEVQSLDERCQLQPTSHPSFQQSKDNKICFDDYTMKSPKQLSTIDYLSKCKVPFRLVTGGCKLAMAQCAATKIEIFYFCKALCQSLVAAGSQLV